jgi:hypothetical protein
VGKQVELAGLHSRQRWCLAQHAFVGRWDGRDWHENAISASASVPAAQVATAPARDGGYWLLLGAELLKYHEGKQPYRHSLAGLRGGIWSISEDTAGNVWICSCDGVLERTNAERIGRPELMEGRTSVTLYAGMTGMTENVFILR